LVSNLEINPFSGIKLLRSAGCSGLLIKQINSKIYLKLKSGWEYVLANNCIATIGIVSNSKHKFGKLVKAGKKRAKGFRPKVRGVAKNPCDHPHGGGNGKKSPPVVPVTA
jgi:ribosomal protein L2